MNPFEVLDNVRDANIAGKRLLVRHTMVPPGSDIGTCTFNIKYGSYLVLTTDTGEVRYISPRSILTMDIVSKSDKAPAIELPFECILFDTEPVEVKNPFSGESCTLTPEAVAVYDTIRGAEMTGDFEIVRKGLDWFRKHFAAEYMVLLD